MTQADNVVRSFTQLHPSIPRVQCPHCGAAMRLACVDAGLTDSQSSQMTFDCVCGFVYQQSERARAGG